MVRHHFLIALCIAALASIFLSACGPPATTPVASTQPAESTPKPADTTATSTEPTVTPEPKTLTVCQGQEPSTLYAYGTAELAAAHIWEAIYDGPIDTVNFSRQPVVLEKLPSLADGDALINAVDVGVGSKVVDDSGNPIELSAAITTPLLLRPAQCASSECAVKWLPISGTLRMDQMVVTFKMKPGITWADGTPVKASDSVYGWTLYADPDTPSGSRYLYDRSASYQAKDDLTVVWTGLPGYRDSAYMANFIGFMPEHQLSKYTAKEMPSVEEAAHTPMGYGPFTVKEWVEGDHITVVKNPHYFRASEGLPHIDTVIFRFVGENANPAIAAALAGECDILTQDTGLDSQAPLLQDLEAKGVLLPVFVAGTQFEHLDWNERPVESYVRPDFFSDQRMREAMAQCINRQQVIDDLLYGKSIPLASYLPPIHPLYNPDVKVREYDPTAAKALLDEMGWKDIDGDGVRECDTCETPGAEKGVTKLSFKWTSTTAPLRVAYMQIFQANLKDCGFDIIVENIPSQEWFEESEEGPLIGRRFDSGSFAWLTGLEPPCGLYLSSEIPGPENGWAGQNYGGFSDPEFDRACNSAIQSLPGTAEYTRYHMQAQEIFAEKLPSFILYLRLKIAAYRPVVKNFIMDATANSEMWNIENFDLVTP